MNKIKSRYIWILIVLLTVLFDGGYANGTPVSTSTTYGFALHYYNKDHLGSNREVVSYSGTVQQVTNYYPFGAPYADPNAVVGSTLQPFKYNGKELETMHGLNTYDYGARQYDPILCRWDRRDPLCEKYYNISPYTYCHNNPVMFIDPLGEEPTPKEAAYIADHIYGNNDELIGGWQASYLGSTSNGLQYGIYQRKMDNGKMEYALAFAGTNDLEDVKQDVSQFLGIGPASQYGNAVSLGKEFASAYEGYEKTIVGHSLGGGLATAASLATEVPAITFNPAAITEKTMSQLSIQNAANANITNYVRITVPLITYQDK